LARIGAAEIRAADDTALGGLSHMPVSDYQSIEQFFRRLRVDKKARRRGERHIDADRCGQPRRFDSGGEHYLVGSDATSRRLDASYLAGCDEQRDDFGLRHQLRTAANSVGDEGQGGSSRLDRAFFRDMQREIRGLGEVWLDARRLGAADTTDSV